MQIVRYCKFTFFGILITLIGAQNLLAQELVAGCAKMHALHAKGKAAKAAILDPAEDQYDMHYVKLDLAVDAFSTSISGSVTTVSEVVNASISEYVFELNSQLTIDSCVINGIKRVFISYGDVRRVSLPLGWAVGTKLTAQVFYHGQPSSGTGFFTNGITNAGGVTFTNSEPYESKDWWPCKMALTDKIDSSEFWLTIDSTLKAGSNGILTRIVLLAGNKVRYEWKNHYPIDYYLISFAVSSFVEQSNYMHFSGSNDSMLIQNYYNAGLISIYPNAKTFLDSFGKVIDYFSTLFGRYPFWSEKYGHCFVPLNGGMENQTMTSVGGSFSEYVLAHELSHQWWGDQVTCASFQDIWLNEGFASYCETLYKEKFYGKAMAINDILLRQSNVYLVGTGSVYVYDTTNEQRIFNAALSYDKGACVVHMLRYLAGNDSLFFVMLRNYQQKFKGSVAKSTDLQNIAEHTYGIKLDSFFNEWVYGVGYPEFLVQWNQNAKTVAVYLEQESNISFTAVFHIPIEIQFKGAQGDTIVSMDLNSKINFAAFSWSKPVDTVIIDPNHWIPHQMISTTKIAGLSVKSTEHPLGFLVYPNPVDQVLFISKSTTEPVAEIRFYNSLGQFIQSAVLPPNQKLTRLEINAWPSGEYWYQINGENINQQSGHFMHP